MTGLMEKYSKEVVPALHERLKAKNKMSLPRIDKVVVNMGIGLKDKDALKSNVTELGVITGQKPVVVKAKKSISNFKLREGVNIGAKVTLRGSRMYDFLDRLINASLPRIRDFRGISKDSFDGRGNYTFGIKDQSIFPEIDPDKIASDQGMDVTIVTTAKSDSDAKELLKLIGLPFEN